MPFCFFNLVKDILDYKLWGENGHFPLKKCIFNDFVKKIKGKLDISESSN